MLAGPGDVKTLTANIILYKLCQESSSDPASGKGGCGIGLAQIDVVVANVGVTAMKSPTPAQALTSAWTRA